MLATRKRPTLPPEKKIDNVGGHEPDIDENEARQFVAFGLECDRRRLPGEHRRPARARTTPVRGVRILLDGSPRPQYGFQTGGRAFTGTVP